MRILGISALTHNTSAALVEDGKLVAAAEEERFTYQKYNKGFEGGNRAPVNAINWILDKFKLKLKDIDYIAHPDVSVYENLGFDVVKFRFQNFIESISKEAKNNIFIYHHLSHGSSSFRASGFKKSNILTIDGVGEGVSTCLFVGKNNEIELIRTYPEIQSIGFLYTRISELLGLGPFGWGEGKTMALASFGKVDPTFIKMMTVTKHDYKINNEVLKEFEKYRRVSGEFSKKQINLATTLQYLVEKAAIELVDFLHEATGYKKICIAGGVGLNSKMNGAIFELPFIKDIFIQPAANDAGLSVGAALEAYAKLGVKSKFRMNHAYLGPEYSDKETEETLRLCKLKYEYYDDIEGIAAELIAKGKIIGWFQGRMEFGPRALGNRSILADPTDENMKNRVNHFVKHREHWRPFAPSVLKEKQSKYFESNYVNPFMTIVFNIKQGKEKEIPAVSHVDGTARIQTVEKKTNPKFYKLIKKFEKEKGVPLVLNTSFNDKNQPIVRTPSDAIKTFYSTGMDYLIINNFLLKK
jgi:carbamoyltransferase